MAHGSFGIRTNLEVRDVGRSIAFYHGMLGLDPIVTMGEPATFAILAAGDAPMAIAEAGANRRWPHHCLVTSMLSTSKPRSNVVASVGAEITGAVTTHLWGMRDFVFRDSDGHQIAVGQRAPDLRSARGSGGRHSTDTAP